MAKIFESYFEGGNLDEWDSSLATGEGNTIAADAGAAHAGSYGCKCHLAGAAGDTKVREGTFADQSEVYIRWYIKFVTGFSMTSGDELELARGWNDAVGNSFAVKLYYDGTNYYLFVTQYGDSGGFHIPGYQAGGWLCDSIINNNWHCIEYHFKAGTGADGVVELFIDGVDRLGGSDDYDMDTIRVGMFDIGFRVADAGTSGDLYMDDVVVDDSDYIGIPRFEEIHFDANINRSESFIAFRNKLEEKIAQIKRIVE